MRDEDETLYVKIAPVDNLIEAQVLESILEVQNIPYRIRSFHDTAYDGLFQFQKGFGEIFAPERYRRNISEIIAHIRETDPSNPPENKRRFNMAQPIDAKAFDQALRVGRPPNIERLFPNSKALIVSGKYVDRAMLAKGKSISIAANGRSYFVIRGALLAAQRANSCIIIEIAKSEGGASAYCAVNYWNMSRIVDALCNELHITVPVAVHADHYGIKNDQDIETAKMEIPSMFDAGITSIAIDASHMTDDKNLLASIALNPLVPKWAGLETEVGEIKGKTGLSTVDEALFLIRGLNAHGIFPDWIALNNGTTHGIEESDQGIQVELTAKIHEALTDYHVSGAQHGTSGNSTQRLKEIATKTRTTKANVATALQMISWGLEVNDYGNAILDSNGSFIKVKNQGVSEQMWENMVKFSDAAKLKAGDYKKLNLPFESKLLSQTPDIRERMSRRVEDFVYNMLVTVFNARDTAPIAIEQILQSGSYDPGPKAGRIEDPGEWTPEKITRRATLLNKGKGESGNFDD